MITALRYWISNNANPADMRYMYFDFSEFTLNYNGLLDLCGFPVGNQQTLKLQLQDNHGQWSSVVTGPYLESGVLARQ